MSLLDVNADLDLALDIAAPIDAAVAANANVAAPIDAAVGANVLSFDSTAAAVGRPGLDHHAEPGRRGRSPTPPRTPPSTRERADMGELSKQELEAQGGRTCPTRRPCRSSTRVDRRQSLLNLERRPGPRRRRRRADRRRGGRQRQRGRADRRRGGGQRRLGRLDGGGGRPTRTRSSSRTWTAWPRPPPTRTPRSNQ